MSRLSNGWKTTLVVGVGALFALGMKPAALAAQQTASVLVRVNVISLPMTGPTLDSLQLTMRDSVPQLTRARAMAHARSRGLRVAITRSPRPDPAPVADPGAVTRERDVLHMEYVAN